ncbi:YncE family protein [Cytobacillus purgationiresistens]|uniref:DNA-binding beta-propeller fold protein YncE n=1 Tax=Cytobacillus purgationiresistens TaxID=863449 RepID=A0ABU0AR77_9BACI|nr:WD40 repeat domain-containing protein [Cytobacillus purgationiresistens]MDQ0273713.1 DNA-binding beta-propeller fold protein YncE [Cytobacillus purgationiresistens]
MSNLYKLFYLLAFTGFLTACHPEHYQPIDSDANIAATINIKDMTVSFIDIDSREKITDWAVHKPYTGGIIFPDRDTFLLYGSQLETADLYSLSTGEIIGQWEVGEGIVNGLLLENKKEIAFVNENDNYIHFVDLKGKESSKMTTEKDPFTVTQSADGSKMYVLSFNHEVLSVIDLQQMQRLDGFKIHSFAAGALLLDDQNELWVGGHGEGIDIERNIHIYDATTGELKKKIAVPTMPVDFAVMDDSVYIVSHGSNTLYKVAKEGEVLDSKIIGANPFTIKALDNELLVAGYDSSDVHFINPDDLRANKSVKVGSGPFQIVLREKK